MSQTNSPKKTDTDNTMHATLLQQGHPLAVLDNQRRTLRSTAGLQSFEARMQAIGLAPLHATAIEVFQINVGRMCNQTCTHCHVDAGPDRKEIMSRETMQLCIDALAATDAAVVDITGGAPELNPNFRWLVDQVVSLGRHVIDRSNLTILLTPGHRDLSAFLADRGVEIIASLPCYTAERTNAQRGERVFEKSIAALRLLNGLGYGRAGSGLTLNLVYNPAGASLPPGQQALEADYKRELGRRFGIVFNRLYTITNLPINRFLNYLLETGQYESYMRKLAGSFNRDAARAVMCRTMLSVGWDGRLYDCDFNQMLDVTINHGVAAHIRGFDPHGHAAREICTGNHCYACTAGAGSSCTGAVAH